MKIEMGLVFALLALPLAGFAGGTVPNGGDGVFCAGAPFTDGASGQIFTYEYIAGMREGFKPSDFTRMKTLALQNAEMLGTLRHQAPVLFERYEDFLLQAQTLWGAPPGPAIERPNPRSWVFRENERQTFPTGLLPRGCRGRVRDDGFIDVWRLVSRYDEGPNGILYSADQVAFLHMVKNEALQGSILLVHEWLWDEVSNDTRNRQINLFLHSKKARAMTPEKFQSTLLLLGFPYDALFPETNERL